MRVIPNGNYRLAGTIGGVVLDSTKIYDADIASNQPNYIEEGLIFVQGILLRRWEYTVVRTKVDEAFVDIEFHLNQILAAIEVIPITPITELFNASNKETDIFESAMELVRNVQESRKSLLKLVKINMNKNEKSS